MSKSPITTQNYIRNKGSPLHQYNRTEAIINNNNDFTINRASHTFYEPKDNSKSKFHFVNYRPTVTQHIRSAAQTNTQSCTFRYEPSNFPNFYPCSTKNDSENENYESNNIYYAENTQAFRNKRPTSQLNSNQMPFSKKFKTIAMKAQQNRITDKLTTLQEKIAKMKATIDEKKNQFKSFVQNEKNENISKRENSQVEKNKNNSMNKFKIQRKRKHNLTETNESQHSPKSYLKKSIFKNSPTFKDSLSKSKYESIEKVVTRVSNDKHYHSINKNPYCIKQNWVYYVSQVIRGYKDKQSLVRQHVQTSLGVLKLFKSSKIPSYETISQKSIHLKKPSGYQKKKTIIFDLDETLVHCNETPDLPFHEKVSVKLPNGQATYANINIRPYAKQILKNLNPYFEIIIFTASHSCYANAIIDLLDPQNKYVHHRLFREACVKSSQGIYVKDLRVINRNLEDMVLVDNAAYSYAYQIDNGVPIIPYYEGQLDFELQALETYLYKIISLQDVRELNKKTFKLSQYTNYQEVQSLIKQLYLWSYK